MAVGVEGLRILITGGAVGIGAGTARLAASRGACVTVSDVNDEAGEALVEKFGLLMAKLFIVTPT